MKRAKQFWLMKSEPTVFSFDDLKARPWSTDHWEGVRNYQARNYMRQMRKGDLVLFYHSNCETPGTPRWFMVEVKWREAFLRMVTLREMRNTPQLGGMKLMQKGQRLSVMPVTKEEFEKIRSLGMKK